MATDLTPYEDLLAARANYWCGLTGREDPPPPSYRTIDGKPRLGRYMDPYGCQANMLGAQIGWQKKYIPILLGAGAGILFAEVDWIFLIFFLPLMGLFYFAQRRRYRNQYVLYYEVLDAIERTGEAQWVPYDRWRLSKIKEHPEALWP
jgi:hypothetical protein